MIQCYKLCTVDNELEGEGLEDWKYSNISWYLDAKLFLKSRIFFTQWVIIPYNWKHFPKQHFL